MCFSIYLDEEAVSDFRSDLEFDYLFVLKSTDSMISSKRVRDLSRLRLSLILLALMFLGSLY